MMHKSGFSEYFSSLTKIVCMNNASTLEEILWEIIVAGGGSVAMLVER